jgi:chromate reductase, NAD(P)H dehydrogenase (quinone)
VALITASASGAAAHESLQLVMKTIYADVSGETQLLVQGAKGKIDAAGRVTDTALDVGLKRMAEAFVRRLKG